MNRRDALKTMVGLMASFILPAPRRQLKIDLREFCGRYVRRDYDPRLPYCLEDWTYATDASICVRVRPEAADKVDHQGRVPPFESLSWNHERIRGWRAMPRRDGIPAADSECLTCRGSGLEGDRFMEECEKCDGTGSDWVGTPYHFSHPVSCKACKGKGIVMPPGAVVCRSCKGEPYGVRPSIVQLDGVYFGKRYCDIIEAHGGEYLIDYWHAMKTYPMLKFRFDGADGLLMGMDAHGAERRIKEAANA